MDSLEVSAIIFCCIFAGAILGMGIRTIIPEHHLNNETKDVVKVCFGLVGTMAALLLGLLVASAKSSYDVRSSEITQLAANTILLDRALEHYGPATREIRRGLKTAVEHMILQVWPENGKTGGFPLTGGGEILFDQLQALAPHSEAQRALQSQAESLAIKLGQIRLLLFTQSGTSISRPFLVVVVFWLSMLFLSFGLFAPPNAIAITALLVAAISVAGALFLIQALDHPFSGLIQISSAPLRSALAALGQ